MTRLLDASTARVRMLIAPAGYGKTTLAEQWTSAPGRVAVWYQCRKASADVAHLAVGIADAASRLLPGCDVRLRERLLATKDPATEVDVLAEILAEDLNEWPDNAWLVIDDYHLLGRAWEAEAFVDALVQSSNLNTLIASRRRPAWWTSRLALYEALFEIDQAELAMDTHETNEVLKGRQPAQAILELSLGWPAAVSLAAVLDSRMTSATAPARLYDFFAAEVFDDLGPDAQMTLARLAVAPMLTRPLVAKLLGHGSEQVITDVLRAGLMSDRTTRLEIHPLVRAFITRHMRAHVDESGAVGICLEHYIAGREWDAAFDLIEEHRTAAELAILLDAALDDLLHDARLATLDKWVATRVGDKQEPIFDIVRAEVSLRRAKYASARTLAERALRHSEADPKLSFRALKVAGRAAHSANEETKALAYFRRAEALARNEQERRDAQLAQLMCATALESAEAESLLAELIETVADDSAEDLIRLAGRRLMFELNFGAVKSLDEARDYEQLLGHVADPLVRCSFRSPYATALVLGSHYPDALSVATSFAEDAATHRLDLALPYALIAQGLALSGLRRFAEAEALLVRAGALARASGDDYGIQAAYAGHVRSLVQAGDAVEACAIEPPDLRRALPNMYGEVTASRGLALACAGRMLEAERSAHQASGITRGVEANALVAAILGVLAVERGESDAHRRAESLVQVAFETGAVDMLVTAYRSCDPLLRVLLTTRSTSERTVFAVQRAGDEELLAIFGESAGSPPHRALLLTPREREISELAARPMSNREIARMLFISEGTVKTHLHRIFEKLGVKSRHGLSRAVEGWRRDQAAPTATVDEGPSSVGS